MAYQICYSIPNMLWHKFYANDADRDKETDKEIDIDIDTDIDTDTEQSV